MSQFMQEKWAMYEGTHGMRDEMLGTLTDADLAFTPGGSNATLGVLVREMGDVEYSYAQSLRNFTQDFAYHNDEAGLDGSVVRLTAWLQSVDADMKAALDALSDEDWQKPIKRDSGYEETNDFQMDI